MPERWIARIYIGLAYKRLRTAVYLHGVESAVGMVVVRLTVPNVRRRLELNL